MSFLAASKFRLVLADEYPGKSPLLNNSKTRKLKVECITRVTNSIYFLQEKDTGLHNSIDCDVAVSGCISRSVTVLVTRVVDFLKFRTTYHHYHHYISTCIGCNLTISPVILTVLAHISHKGPIPPLCIG